jgi:hypothetical protein
MMTRDEFVDRLKALRREALKFLPVCLIVYLGALAAVGPAERWLEKHPSTAWMANLVLPAVIVLIFCNVAFLKWDVKRRLRKYGLLCPACGKPLTKPAVKLEGFTGKCGSCGAVVFED